MLHFKDFFNELSKSSFLNKSDNDLVFYELAKKLTSCFGLSRINIWLFSEDEQLINCVGHYTQEGDSFSKGEIIRKIDCPVYFNHLLSDEIISIDDVATDVRIAELKNTYCTTHRIHSMMDVPIRIGGKLAGVVCYEDTSKPRRWTLDEEYFAIAVNQIIAMAIEAQKRRVVQKKLERALAEKERLMHEMHHRIKNNLSLLVSLLRIQSRESESSEVKEALEDFQNRIFSISKIHEQLYRSNNFQDISLDVFLRELTSEYKNMHPDIQYQLDVEQCSVSTDKIVSIGLICSEVISNAIKYAFLKKSDSDHKIIQIVLREVEDKILLRIADNGSGFIPVDPSKSSSLGVYLINDLSEEIGAKCTTQSSNQGVSYHFEFN
jgi:two-component sensor histidine kinase